jgi:hypothetical protein
MSTDDLGRRNTIVRLLTEWGLVTPVNPDKYKEPQLSLARLKIIPHKDKSSWDLIPKYHIGK